MNNDTLAGVFLALAVAAVVLLAVVATAVHEPAPSPSDRLGSAVERMQELGY